MKIIPIIAIAIIAMAVGANAQVNNVLSITNLGIMPQPAVAGSNITVTFQLFNSYYQQLSNVNVWLTSSSPILNVSPSHTYLISAIGSGIYGGIGYNIFEYKFHLPDSLTTGLYTINVVASYEVNEGFANSVSYVPGESIMPISIYVYGKPKLGINAVLQGSMMPGQALPVELQVSNIGTGNARNITLSVNGNNGIALIGQTTFNVSALQPGQEQAVSAVFYLDSNVTAGVHNITVNASYTSDTGSYTQSIKIPMKVVIEKPNVVASIVSAMPQMLTYGYNQTLSIAVQNIGSGTARNISVGIYGSNTLEILGSASNFVISALPPGQEAIENVLVSAINASSYGYIYANITYYGANYANKTEYMQAIPVKMQNAGKIEIINAKSSIYPGIGYGPVTFEIKNTGNEAIKQCVLSLQSIYPISPVDGNAYLNELLPNQTANVTFYVSVDPNGKQGQYPVTLYEQWKQSNLPDSQMLSSSNNYGITVESQASGNSYIYAAAIVVIIAIAIAAIAAKKGKRKARK